MKVLLLEDQASLSEMISGHLARRGFAVDSFTLGRDALEAAEVTAYDAVILDLGLPDMDGMDVLKTLRARSVGGLPALIVTARDAVEDRVLGLNAGADDYLVKPFDLVEMEARLRALLRRPGEREAIVHHCGRLSFDPAAREASVNGSALDLTRREAALLEALIRVPTGRMVIKDALEERLYSFDDDVSANALEAAVSRLRKKLSSADAGVRIDVTRGIGYRLLSEGDP